VLYAKNEFGEHIGPTSGSRAYCTTCGATVIARCGIQRIHHWAHKSNTSCSAITEPESEWKHAWRQIFKQDNCEVTINNVFFDAKGYNDTPIMLRVTAMDNDQAMELQGQFPNMIWIFDTQNLWGNLKLTNKGNHHSFRWFHPNKKLTNISPLFLHFPCGRLFEIKKAYIEPGKPCGGWGKFVSWHDFYLRYLNNATKQEYDLTVQPRSLKNRQDIDFDKVNVHTNEKLDYYATSKMPYINCSCEYKEGFENCITLKRIRDHSIGSG